MMTKPNISILRRCAFFIICIFDISTGQIIGYDCSHNNMNYTIINVNHVDQCKEQGKSPYTTSAEIQLVQIMDDISTRVFHCEIVIERTIFYCGMHHHSSMVKGGFMRYPYKIFRTRCLNAINTGELTLFQQSQKPLMITNLLANKSYRYRHTFAGELSANGACKGSTYSDEFGYWENVIVEGQVTIKLGEFTAKADTSQDKVHLQDRLSCTLSQGYCFDDITGEYYWNEIPQDACKTQNHLVLYEGYVNLTSTKSGNSQWDNAILTVANSDMLFSLQVTGQYLLCNLNAYRTEHPKLIVVRKTGLDFLFKKTAKSSTDLDLFTYMNSKFVFIERNIQTNMEDLYKLIMKQKCDLNTQALRLLITISKIDPNEFAYLLKKEPGYTATRLGEVIYISQCTPAFVYRRKTDKCYNELPVSYKNDSYFLLPKTHLLQKYGSEINCNSVFQPMFLIGDTWYKVNKQVVESVPPLTLTPEKDQTWKFRSIQNLAYAGIYSQEDLDDLRSHLMYGQEREAIETILVRSTQGLHPDYQGISPVNMFDDEMAQKLGDKIGAKLWNWFSTFGNISSGVIGVMFIMKCVKWIVDSVINGTLLYQVFGFSMKICACVLDSLTHFFVQQNHYRQTPQNTDIELGSSLIKPQVNTNIPGDIQDMRTSNSDNRVVDDPQSVFKVEYKDRIYPSLENHVVGNIAFDTNVHH